MFMRAKTAIAGVTAAAMLAAGSLTVAPTAQAASLSPAVYYGESEAPVILAGHKSKWRWRRHHRRHHHHRRDNDFPAGIFGFAAGALIGSMLAQPRHYRRSGSDFHSYCASKYKTYKPWTRTFTGYDGREHYCRIP